MHPHDAAAFEQDVRAREDALDRTQSFIVQAPAGSGKTELLIQRYLALLATVDAPEEIVAITFTRKAAAEMRVRILAALRLATQADAEHPHRRRTQELAREALRRDALRNWALREQPGRMRILTIDSLNGWIARQMPWLSRLGPAATVTDDASVLYRETVHTVLLTQGGGSALRDAVRRLLVHLDNRFGDIEQLLVDMLSIRDQWVELIEGGVDSAAARAILEQSLENIIRNRLEALQSRFEGGLLEEAVQLARHAASAMEADSAREPGELGVFLRDDGIPGTEPGELPAWQGLRRLLLTDTDGYRAARGITVAGGFAATDPMKQRMIALVDRVREDETLRVLLAGTRQLPAPVFDEEQWDIVGCIVTVLGACAEELRRQFTRRGATDHIEVAAAARRALGAELEPSDLAMLLEYRIRHILVDEFQDTSTGQFALLQQLTAGWSAPDQHTLFLVGDPMQSIYRFREAEVGLFLQVWAHARIGAVPLRRIRLTRNFRSQPGIVRWINEVCSRIMPDEDNPAEGAVAFSPSVAARGGEEGGEEYRIVFSGNRSEEAAVVADFLRGVLDGEECGEVQSVAVLVRSRTHLAELVPALRAQGLRFRAVEIESLGENEAVRDLMALTRALLFPADRIAWLAVLRSPVCGLSLADLHALCRNDTERPLPAMLRDGARVDALSEDGRKRLARVLPVLEGAMALRSRRSLRALVESCWTALGVPALLDARDVDAARAFLALLEGHDLGGDLDDLRQLEREMARLFAPPDPGGDPRLQIMTIHKAKGLEFDVVALPRLDGIARPESDRLLLWERSVADEGAGFLLAPLRARGSDTASIYAYIRGLRRRKAEQEMLRLLYVAATRAKRRLLLTATLGEKSTKDGRDLRAPQARSFLGVLWPLVEDEVRGRYREWTERRGEEPAVTATTGGTVFRRVPADWSAPALPADTVVAGMPEGASAAVAVAPVAGELRAGRSARTTGVVVHALLARIGAEGARFWTAADATARTAMLAALYRDAGFPSPGEEEAGRAASAVDRMLEDERGRWILQPHEEADCELAMTGVEGDEVLAIRIDRTFVTSEGVRWIVDYKTATHEGADLGDFLDTQAEWYGPQLRRYARILRKWDGRPVRAALYFPQLQEWREIALTDDSDSGG